MVTCFLQGGLGNQMFQIAATTVLAYRNNDIAVFDSKNHNLPLQGRKTVNYMDNIFRNINFSEDIKVAKVYKEEGFTFNEIPYEEQLALYGYFQSEKYFHKQKQYIKELFSPTDNIKRYLLEKYPQISERNISSIHVRRGDYLKLKHIHSPCSLKYYLDATKKVKSDHFFVFSDDPEWCKGIFKSDKYTVISEEQDYNEMYLMSMCKNNIIANSSFSWWGAWLNNNEDKVVIAPKQWFGPSAKMSCHDIVPDEWLRL